MDDAAYLIGTTRKFLGWDDAEVELAPCFLH
jgi:hypothetical protein